MVKLDDLRNNSQKKKLKGHFWKLSYELLYVKEFDLYIDIVLIFDMFYKKILFSFCFLRFMWEDSKMGRCPRNHNKQIIIIENNRGVMEFYVKTWNKLQS